MSETSTKPYLLRAIYEWCTDNGYTPYVAALVDANTRVPREFVKNGEIVLNISFAATSALKMDNDFISFSARFGGIAREISVPVENVVAIYARENGQGMAFEVARVPASNGKQLSDGAAGNAGAQPAESGPNLTAVPSASEKKDDETSDGMQPDDEPDPPKKGGRPTLTRIK
ncbi:MAG TPA: ClpXP protease specificity-enhancing factor [Paucimonas sp.]|nr:ClpXP protease specificity-enhancing factor [Paucimonas sp.]HJW57214.1 ClpXP protease specificity-enhancing factor [Burkholderiaceae bacterium]